MINPGSGEQSQRIISPVVAHEDITAVMSTEGRSKLGIDAPGVLGHYGQQLAKNFASFAKDLMIARDIPPEVAGLVARNVATLGLRHIVNVASFGYGLRVLEERAGAPSTSTVSSPQPIEITHDPKEER